jgi:cobyrinic acid a,c-diamide synthase
VLKIAEKDGLFFAFRILKGHGITDKMDGLCYKKVLATYTHLHALGTKEWPVGIIKAASDYKRKKLIFQ